MSSSVFKECKAIKDRLENSKRWLKSPNGEESNLSEDLWVLARTPNFKKWFGDWEISTINFKEDLKRAVAEIDIDEVVKSDPITFEIPINSSVRRNLYRELTRTLRKTYVNRESGLEVVFGKRALDELKQHDYMNPEHLASLKYFPNFIEDGKFLCS